MKKLRAAFSSNNSREQERGAYGNSPQHYGSGHQPASSGQQQRGPVGQYPITGPPSGAGIRPSLSAHSPYTANTPTAAFPISPSAPMYAASVPRPLAPYYPSPPHPNAHPTAPFVNTTPSMSFPPAMMHAAASIPGQNTTGPNWAPIQQPRQVTFPNAAGSQVIPFYEDPAADEMIAALSIFGITGPSASSSNAAIGPADTEILAPMLDLTSISCRWCERCKSGIAYYSDSFICVQCKFWLCRSCRNVHTTLHSPRVRVQMRQWTEFSSEFQRASTCSKCSTLMLTRLQCGFKACDHSLCMSCFQSSVKLGEFLEAHLKRNPMHLDFFAIYPEEWRVRQEWKVSPCNCSKEGVVDPSRPVSVSHCEKCHAPIEIGHSIYWCRPCREIWGFTQWICEPCYLDTSEDHVHHKQKHDFTKALIQEDSNLPDSHKERFYCRMCQQWLGESDYFIHNHSTGEYYDTMSVQRNPDLLWVLSPRQKDWQRLNMYRNCDKVFVAQRSNQYPDEFASNTALSKCMQCQFLLAYNKSATICIKGKCNHCIYCSSCTDARRIDHRHKNSTYIVKLQRKANLPLERVNCAKCRKDIPKSLFMGFFCGHCKYFAVCWSCIGAAAKGGSFELPEGLPHPTTPNSNSSNSSKCPALDWILIYQR